MKLIDVRTVEIGEAVAAAQVERVVAVVKEAESALLISGVRRRCRETDRKAVSLNVFRRAPGARDGERCRGGVPRISASDEKPRYGTRRSTLPPS